MICVIIIAHKGTKIHCGASNSVTEPEYNVYNVTRFLESYYSLTEGRPSVEADEGPIPRIRYRATRNAAWEAGACIKADLDEYIPRLSEPGRGVITMLYLVGYETYEVASRYRITLAQMHQWRKAAIRELVGRLNG